MHRSDITQSMLPSTDSAPVRWRISEQPVGYEDAVAEMEREVAEIADGRADELVWLVEHPPLYTAGTSADAKDLLAPQNSLCTRRAAAANTPITGRDSASSTCCSTSSAAGRMCAPSSRRSRMS